MPIDKTNCNVVIICNIFYDLTLMKELGVHISNSNNNKTYETMISTNENDIIDKYSLFIYKLCKNEEKIIVYLTATAYKYFIKVQKKHSL